MSDEGEEKPVTDKVVDLEDARKRREAEPPPPPWLGRLARNQHQAILASTSNAIIILRNDPLLTGLLSYNEFSSEYTLTRPPPPPDEGMKPAIGPYPRSWTPADVISVLAYLQRAFNQKFNKQTTEDAMVRVAEAASYHPVCDWLKGLKWDGVPRIDNWLVNVYACEDAGLREYYQAIGSKFLIAAVRRVRKPGWKFDNILVLEGKQDLGKSLSVRKLFGDGWFSDAMPTDLGSKDAALSMLGVWGFELSEIEPLIRSESETVKSFLSRSVDRFRPPYGRTFVNRPRQCVMVGTTNTDDYLRDVTGNRRVWPVRCACVSIEYIEANREQLWAEAAYRESMGEDTLAPTMVREAAKSVTQARMSQDVWTDRVISYLDNPHRQRDQRSHNPRLNPLEATVADILTYGIQVPPDRQDKRAEMRIGKILRQIGWERNVKWRNAKAIRVWLRPDHPELGGGEMGSEGGGEGSDDDPSKIPF